MSLDEWMVNSQRVDFMHRKKECSRSNEILYIVYTCIMHMYFIYNMLYVLHFTHTCTCLEVPLGECKLSKQQKNSIISLICKQQFLKFHLAIYFFTEDLLNIYYMLSPSLEMVNKVDMIFALIGLYRERQMLNSCTNKSM